MPLPDTLNPPKLARRYSARTPHAWCRSPGCWLSVNGRGPEFDEIVSEHVRRTGHPVEIITSASAILSLPEGRSR
jgi:hypothetical protein